jgi:thiamine-phosphate pyrophosphorylase
VNLEGLYPIVDLDALAARRMDPVAFAERVLAARPALVQLRAKSAGARDTLALLRALRPLTRATGSLLFANDRPDLAVLAEADGVHLGQSDLDIADVRHAFPHLKVGLSTHVASELEEALGRRPDYVAFGPVYPTGSKAKPEASVGLEGLAWASERARAAGVPLCAIGGIDRTRAREVSRHASLVAVIGALIPESGALADVAERASALVSALRSPAT